MRKGFTLVELIVVIALIAVLTGAVIGWYNEFKDKQIVDTNGDGIVYYDDITFPQPPNYREILKQHGIDVGELSDEELNELIKELQKEQVIEWFDIAKDECETLSDYAAKLDNVDEKDKGKLREIIGDEVNHALVALGLRLNQRVLCWWAIRLL